MPVEAPTPRRPLPTPPTTRYPASYGPSSTIRPPSSAQVGSNAPGQAYGAGAEGPPTSSHWIPYQSPTVARGSTFFVGSGTQRLLPLGVEPRTKRPPLPPIPTMATPASPPVFTPSTTYSPPLSPKALPAGARALPPTPALPRATQTKVPIGTSSSIMVHSGFWNILAATGSRFYSVAPAFPATLGEEGGDRLDSGYLNLGGGVANGSAGRQPTPMAQRRGITSPTLVGEVTRKKRVSIDMIGRPGGFT